MTPAEEWARAAAIFDHFHQVDDRVFARLTEKQIRKLYLHARDEHGAIKVPSRTKKEREKLPDTLEAEIAAIRAFAQSVGPGLFPAAELEKAIQELSEKYAKQAEQRDGEVAPEK